MIFGFRKSKQEKAVETVSKIIADLYQVEPFIPPLIVASKEDIEKMQRERNELVEHSSSYLRGDGTLVICNSKFSETDLDPEISLHAGLAAELAHTYHKNIGGDNAKPIFDFRWIDKTRLRDADRNIDNDTLILPKDMTEKLVIPMGKKEAPDGYCQEYVLNKLRMVEATKKIREDSQRWNELVKYDLGDIKKLIEANGFDYDKVRAYFRQMIKECEINRTPITDHPAFLVAKQYFHLGSSLGYWLAGIYKDKLTDVESFRKYVKTPIIPITAEDRDIFEKYLQKLNQYLASNKSLVLGVSKF